MAGENRLGEEQVGSFVFLPCWHFWCGVFKLQSEKPTAAPPRRHLRFSSNFHCRLRLEIQAPCPAATSPSFFSYIHHGQKYKSDIPTQTLLQHQIQQNQKSQNTRYATTPVPSCSIHASPSFQLHNDKADFVFIGEYIYPSKKWHDVGQTPTACAMDVQWQYQLATKGSSVYATMRKQNVPRPPDFTHPAGLSNDPINFFNVGYGQITCHLQTIDSSTARPMLSPTATSSNDPPKLCTHQIFFPFFLFSF